MKGWVKLKDGMEIAEFTYQSSEWKTPRRMIAVRRDVEVLPNSTGKPMLFDDQVCRYRCSIYVTNLDLSAGQVWRSYKDRADAENGTRELKYDFVLDSFCMDKFWATATAFRMIMVS